MTRDKVGIISLGGRLNAAEIAWIAMFCSIFIWGVGEVRNGQLGNTDNWYRIGLVVLASTASICVLLNNIGRLPRSLSPPLLLLLVYGIVAMLSSMYIPLHSFYSMWKAIEVNTDLLVVAALLSYGTPRRTALAAYHIVIGIFIAMLLVYWTEAFLWPSRVFLTSRGAIPVTVHGMLPVYNGNALAFLSAAVSLACWCRLQRSRVYLAKFFFSLVLLLGMATLILAQSRTSLIGFCLAVLIYLLLNRNYEVIFFAAVLAGCVVVFAGIGGLLQDYLVRGQSEELLTSFSGRTHAWAAAWALFEQSPILGHGFAAAARTEILGVGQDAPSTLHGALFDVLVGVGILGLIPWSTAIIWLTFSLIRLTCSQNWWLKTALGRGIQAEMVGVLVLILIRSVTSSGLAMHEHTFMLFLAVLVYTNCMNQQIDALHCADGEPIKHGRLLQAARTRTVER